MASEIVCNGRSRTSLPTLEVVKSTSTTIMSTADNIDWLLHIYYARRDFTTCKVIIEKELPDYLNPEYLFFIKGLIAREEGNHLEALRSLQKSIDFNSKNIESYKEIGKTLFEMGRFNQALSVFREAESLSPRQDHEIFHYIGELLHRKATKNSNNNNQSNGNSTEEDSNENEEAKTYFQRAVQNGKKLESYQRLAEIYRKEKDYLKAIEILEMSLQIAPENTEVLTEIGVLYLKINETEKAYEKLLEVTNIDSNSSKGLLAFGAILQSRNDVEGALGKYNQITGPELDSTEIWNNIGLCFFKKKKFIVAISCLRKSVWVSPLNYNSLYNLSLIYIAAQQYASAFHTLAAAINLRKDSAECYMLLGICLRKLEDYENAFTAFERSVMLSKIPSASRNPLVYLNFALFCYQIGKIELATENFNSFLENSQDIILPTDYKFQATKLKSLLQISWNDNNNVDNTVTKSIHFDVNTTVMNEMPSQDNDSTEENIGTVDAAVVPLEANEDDKMRI
ncbi:Bardet-Biedl syndrome 4 protein homolog [Eupeodes corollae]|uniref:Bardet-Biedl syndrome 4 protein homolog n=1 Tax=Eupeodes corollae TaxID=290404 RepID=UPI00248F6F4D|nr:Bardet-Biedl syndrome 4 protein homolog [Eupeodes corollae]